MSESITATSFDPVLLRRTVLRMAKAGSTVHIACAFSLIEILSVLYAEHVRTGAGPDDPDRDWLVLSKGHGVMAQYACLYQLGWLTDRDLDEYFADGTLLKGLSDAHVPGLEVTSGSLGHGLSIAVGMALGAKRSGSDRRAYAIVGDGELNEGACWEAIQLAAHQRLDNLTVIVDENGFQAMGATSEILDPGDLRAKFEAFGFDAVDVDGHDVAALGAALRGLRDRGSERPGAIVAHTSKGHGVSFMENANEWHYTRLDDATFAAAMAELEVSDDA